MAQKTPGAPENTMAQKSYNHETGKWEYVQPPSGHYIPPRPIVLDLSAIDRQFRKQEEAKYERLIQERSLKRSSPQELLETVCKELSSQKLFVMNCDWEQSGRIIQMSRVNEFIYDCMINNKTSGEIDSLFQYRHKNKGYYFDFGIQVDCPIVQSNFPFNYFFTGDPQVKKEDTPTVFVGSVPWKTPFLFLRYLLPDETLAAYGMDEYGFYEAEYEIAKILDEKYDIAQKWKLMYLSNPHKGHTPQKMILPPETIKYGKQFDICKIRGLSPETYRIEMVPVGEKTLLLPCSYICRSKNNTVATKLYTPPPSCSEMPLWGEDRIENLSTLHVIISHNPGIMRMSFSDTSIVAVCVIDDSEYLDTFNRSSLNDSHLLVQDRYILIDSASKQDIAFAMKFFPATISEREKTAARFLLITSAQRVKCDYNWDGMMYPGTLLSDMKVKEITPDELRKLAEENNIDIPEGYNQYFPQS